MDINLKTKVKVLLGQNLSPEELEQLKNIIVKQEAPIVPAAPVALTTEETTEGLTLSWDGELAEKTAINVVSEAGSTAAPDSTYTLKKDGTKITTMGGLVTKIEKVEVPVVPPVEQIQQMETKLSAHVETIVSAKFEAHKVETDKVISGLTEQVKFTAGLLEKILNTPIIVEPVEPAKVKTYADMSNYEKLKFNESNKK